MRYVVHLFKTTDRVFFCCKHQNGYLSEGSVILLYGTGLRQLNRSTICYDPGFKSPENKQAIKEWNPQKKINKRTRLSITVDGRGKHTVVSLPQAKPCSRISRWTIPRHNQHTTVPLWVSGVPRRQMRSLAFSIPLPRMAAWPMTIYTREQRNGKGPTKKKGFFSWWVLLLFRINPLFRCRYA